MLPTGWNRSVLELNKKNFRLDLFSSTDLRRQKSHWLTWILSGSKHCKIQSPTHSCKTLASLQISERRAINRQPGRQHSGGTPGSALPTSSQTTGKNCRHKNNRGGKSTEQWNPENEGGKKQTISQVNAALNQNAESPQLLNGLRL